MIDWDDKELPITTQAQLLGLNRTSLYYKPVEPSPEEIFIKHKMMMKFIPSIPILGLGELLLF